MPGSCLILDQLADSSYCNTLHRRTLKSPGGEPGRPTLSVAARKGAIFAGQSEPAIGLRKENGPEECRRPRDGRSRARRRAGVARVVASGGCAPLRELSTVTATERGKAGSPWGGGMVDGACSPAPDPERPPQAPRPRSLIAPCRWRRLTNNPPNKTRASARAAQETEGPRRKL